MRRLLRFLRLALEHGSAFKSMMRLPEPFGPKCPTCGLPRTQFMPPAHRAALKALTDKEPEELEYVCRCARRGSVAMRPVELGYQEGDMVELSGDLILPQTSLAFDEGTLATIQRVDGDVLSLLVEKRPGVYHGFDVDAEDVRPIVRPRN